MKKLASADVVIFGGGVAGLWLLNRLRQAGLSVVLFESLALGGGQTQKSQGILHGGTKYALHGALSNDALAIADMPDYWKKCLQGQGDINLSDVAVLSNQQYLWSPNKFAAKLTGFLASAALSSDVKPVSRDQYPAVFQNPAFKGELFELNELVIDVPSLTRELVKNNQDAVYKIEPLVDEELKFDNQGKLISVTVYQSGQSIEISAQQFIFAAGSGNEVILKTLKEKEIAMQRRPLHMVIAKLPYNYPLYAHCLGMGKRPRITITTHYTQDSSMIWYLGGLLAEEGVDRDANAQIQAARDELRALFPWIDFSSVEFATVMVDRAEPKQKSGLKPETSYVRAVENIVIAWPTKLVLAPKLAIEVLEHFQQIQLTPQLLDTRELRAWPMPPLARPIWEEAFCKHVA